MNKKMKKAVTLLALSCILLGDREYASAKVYGNKATSGEYKSVSNKTSGGYDHHLYKNTVHGKKYYEKKLLTPVVHHRKNKGANSLAYSTSQSASKTQTIQWTTNETISSEVGTDIDVFKNSVSCSVSAGYGESSARAYSFSKESVVTKTIKSAAPSGYYAMVPGHTYYRMRDLAVNSKNGKILDIYFREPYGKAVIYTIYSKTNESGSWKIYG